jgi:hypothetical protein
MSSAMMSKVDLFYEKYYQDFVERGKDDKKLNRGMKSNLLINNSYIVNQIYGLPDRGAAAAN